MAWDHTPDYVKRPLGPRKERDRKFDGFGCCIYCGETPADGLHDEHALPKGLGGRTEIRNASCRRCEKETHAFEGHAMHTVLLMQRLHASLKKSEPKTITLHKVEDGEWTTIEVAPSEYPVRGRFPIYLPAFAILGILPNIMGKPYASMATLSADQSKDRSVISQVRPEPTEDGIIAERIAPNLDAFSRMIAKIAYCHAIITVGMDGFISLVPSYLKKNNLNLGANYFVGTRMPVTHETEQRGDHHVEIRYERIRGIQTVVANIRLFASWGAPTYHVYLGPATQASWVNAP
jgi:HNH endonuclease